MPSQNGKENIKPIDTVSFRGCHISIFANDNNGPIPLYKAGSPVRKYEDKGEIKTVKSFRTVDMPWLVLCTMRTLLRMNDLEKLAWTDSKKDSGKASDEEAHEE